MSSALEAIQSLDAITLEATALSYFDNQISGHSCLLKGTENAQIYKPYDLNESNFYEYMSKHKDHPLFNFIPAYYGTLQLPKQKLEEVANHALNEDHSSTESEGSNDGVCEHAENQENSTTPTSKSEAKKEWVKHLFQNRFNDNNTRFVRLQDLTSSMDLPCMLDLKMGSVAYNAKKMAHQQKKLSKTTSGSHKFRICGLQVKNDDHESDYFRDKYWGRKIRGENINNALALFFYDGQNVRRNLIKQFVKKLEELAMAIKSSIGHRFYSVSLLLIYDAGSEVALCNGTEENGFDIAANDKIKVRLIDFAHTIRNKTSEEPDDDLLTGVNNLIKCLNAIYDDQEIKPKFA